MNDVIVSPVERRVHANWHNAFHDKVERPKFIFDGLLAGTVGAIVAPGAVGKSFFGLSLGISLTSSKNLLGVEAFNHPELAQGVGYITAEDPMVILEDRMRHFKEFLTPEQQDEVIEKFEVISIHGRSPMLVNAEGRCCPKCERWIDYLCNLASGKKLLMIDTLRKFHQGDENNSGHMTLVTQILDEIASKTNCSILYLHHANKTGSRDKSSDQNLSRGSSALIDNIRYMITMIRMTEQEARDNKLPDIELRSNFVKIVAPKANYRKDNGDVWLERKFGGVLVKANFDGNSNVGVKSGMKEDQGIKGENKKENQTEVADDNAYSKYCEELVNNELL